MSRFRKLSHTLWHCQSHIVWTPKYRFRILEGDVAQEVSRCIRSFSNQKECEVIELNVQKDHVHLIVMIRLYAKYQEEKERRAQSRQKRLF